MKIFRKIWDFIFDKDVWISGSISACGAIIFCVIGGYVLFVTTLKPIWLKYTIVIILALVLYFGIGVVDRWVFKKLGRKSPKAGI